VATNIYLALDGVDGESSDDRHQGEIELESWSFGIASSGTARLGGHGAGAGKAQVSDLSVAKSVDLATPALLQAAASGRRIASATLTQRTAGADPRDFLTMVLAPVLVTSCQLSAASDGRPQESVQLSFGTVQLTYASQAPDGTAGPTTTFGWDATRNGQL
jgi:type VI secretion system secreted protein Hcp